VDSASGLTAPREDRVDRRTKVELFEQIRREYEHGGGTIRGIAKKLGIHRRMVREAVLSAVPVERKTPVRERPKLEPAMAFIRVRRVIPDLYVGTREVILQLANLAVITIEGKETCVSHSLYDVRISHEGRRGGSASSK
jgi:hypothetical protein